jgi:hypothetical protein
MNTFKKIANATTNHNTKKTILSNSINIESIYDFPALNNMTKMENTSNFNFIDATKKKVEENKEVDDTGLCTIYYDKVLKKIVTHNFPKKMYRDDDDDNIDDLDTPARTTIKNQELHHGMNKAIRNIMERRDKFIDQYGVDEYIRDYLPKDSPYLYSRYYYRNKYMNNYKNKVVSSIINHGITCENNVIYPRNDSDLTQIQYDDVDIDIDIDIDTELLNIDDDIDDEDDIE